MKFLRSFHPIGQGAFYTEKHYLDGRQFNIVYDCGSQSPGMKFLHKTIAATFKHDDIIDILFISHFDKDHINGIEYLKKHYEIKHVVIPLIDDRVIIFYKIVNHISGHIIRDTFYDKPEEYFEEKTKITKIKPVEGNNSQIELGANDSHLIDTKGSKEESGCVIALDKDIKWYYIPFNFNRDIRVEQFWKILEEGKLKAGDLDTTSKIISHKSELKEAYKKIVGGTNKNSMILFSGIDKVVRTISSRPLSNICPSSTHQPFDQSGCLFTGDIDLNQQDVIDQISGRLQFFLPYIGTIQIPHHGCFHNYNNAILGKHEQTKFAVISYGENDYGHPSGNVIIDLVDHGLQVYMVTYHHETLVMQYN